MAITDAQFDTEQELQDWAFANSATFFGQSILLPGCRITTPSGKHGLPDGFVFNFDQRAWWVVECELLAHGVWQHIAEQVTRFVVAARNPATLRQIRDKLFERIIENNQVDRVATVLQTDRTRLLQQLELFLEGVSPSLAIFIDETNQDLLDLCDALDIPSEIYRVKKFVVNGKAEYYSPDKDQPTVVFDSDSSRQEGSSAFDAIEQLGGGEVVNSRNRCYRLHDGRIVKVQVSKFHERQETYWYGISPSAYEQAKTIGCTDFIFVMGAVGFVVLPVGTVDSYLRTAHTSRNPNGTIKHYHLHITAPPEVTLKGYGNADDVDVSRAFQTLN